MVDIVDKVSAIVVGGILAVALKAGVVGPELVVCEAEIVSCETLRPAVDEVLAQLEVGG